jgi:hypothetical protein
MLPLPGQSLLASLTGTAIAHGVRPRVASEPIEDLLLHDRFARQRPDPTLQPAHPISQSPHLLGQLVRPHGTTLLRNSVFARSNPTVRQSSSMVKMMSLSWVTW